MERFDPKAQRFHLWIVDLTDDSFSPFTFGSANEWTPVWSPDGTTIVYTGSRVHPNSYFVEDLYLKPSTGARGEERLPSSQGSNWAMDWSKDGKYIVYSDQMTSHLWILPFWGDRKPALFTQTEFKQPPQATFSPDGKWIAYASDETGSFEVFVSRFPASAGGKWQVSTAGGEQPQWRVDGKELFYISPDRKLMSVSVQTDDDIFRMGVPVSLFQTRLISNVASPSLWERNEYVVTANGQRFLMEAAAEEQEPSTITVILNWQALLKH